MAEGGKKSNGGKTVHLVNIKTPKRTKERLKFSFQRLSATLTVLKSSEKVDISLMLVDINEFGCGVFVSAGIERGTLVDLMIVEPRVLHIKGAVVWSTAVNTRLDSSNMRLPFRCGLQFMYANDAEKETVREFCSKLKENILHSHAKHMEVRQPAALPENFVGATAADTTAAAPAAPVVAAVPGEAPVASVAAPEAGAAVPAPEASSAVVAETVSSAPAVAEAPAVEAVPAPVVAEVPVVASEPVVAEAPKAEDAASDPSKIAA